MAFATYQQFCDGVLRSTLLEAEPRAEFATLQTKFTEARDLAQELIRRDWLTAFQANQVFQGKWQNLVIGPYVLLERIGEGGMGQVFRARQKLLNRIVALKLIRKECLDNPRVVQRFQREIRAAGQLSHPHIIRAYDADQVDGTYYIAMEFVDGQDLAKMVKEQGPLPINQACEYIRQSALGLQHAFERGLVHRDIKPANLLVMKAIASDRRRSSAKIPIPKVLSPKSSATISRAEIAAHYPWGVVKLLDLGLARCTDSFTGEAATHLTQIGSIMGTPEYIAPEQARDSHTSDVRADLYSLGCTFYFLITGQPPFPTGTVTEKLLQHQLDEPESMAKVRADRLFLWKDNADNNPAVPAEVDRVVRKLLEKRPERRFQTPIELANELAEVMKVLAERSRQRPVGDVVEDVLTKTQVLRPVAARSNVCEDEKTIVQPLPNPITPRQRSRRPQWVVPVALAMTGGFFFIAVATVLAAVLSRGMHTQASTVAADQGKKVKEAETPLAWKKALQRTLARRASWEETRAELAKHREALPAGEPRQQLDHVISQLPTPFDDLQRTKFDGILPAQAPAEFVGVYGPPKNTQWKPVLGLVGSPNGRLLAATEDNGIRLYDLQGSVLPYKISAHDRKVTTIAMSANGQLLASASEDGIARTWNATTRERVASFALHKKPITHIAFHPNGNDVASAAKERTIRFWNARTGDETLAIDSQMDEVSALAFSSDAKFIFWTGSGNQVGWLHLGDKNKSVRGSANLTIGNPRHLVVQPKGDLVLVAGDLGAYQVHAWDGTKLTKRGDVVKMHQQISQLAFSPDGKTFVSAGVGPTALLWNAADLQIESRMPYLRNPAYSVYFSPEGRHLAVGGANNQVTIVRLAEPNLALVNQAAK